MDTVTDILEHMSPDLVSLLSTDAISFFDDDSTAAIGLFVKFGMWSTFGMTGFLFYAALFCYIIYVIIINDEYTLNYM